MTRNASLSGAIHDVQARLGSIRIAVTAVAGLDLDAETRHDMLTNASDESLRASAELAGVSALATCLLDGGAAEPCDVAAAVETAAEVARLGGLDVRVEISDPPSISARPDSLAAALAALLRIVGGAGKQVAVRVATDGIDVRGADTEVLPPITGYLVEALDVSLPITFGALA